ncbi:MAG: hypothetical protein WC650_00425 [Candidatus Doudnabacteria bacterium]
MENSEGRIQVWGDTAILVNLDAPPELPFDKAIIEPKIGRGSGWVKVEKCEDGLYINDHRVILYLSEQQKGGKVISGFKLNEELLGKPVLHPNILDALLEHLDLIPEDWKKRYLYIFFWAVIFRDSDGRFFVRFLYFDGERWQWGYSGIYVGWDNDDPAALLV